MTGGSVRHRGFLLPAVLGITLVAALLALQAASASGTIAALATMRVLQQRAFAVADRGVEVMLASLQAGTPPGPTQTLLSSTPGERAETRFAETARAPAPSGYSAGRFFEHHYELRSAGHSARGVQVVQIQGVSRLEPVEPAAMAEADTP